MRSSVAPPRHPNGRPGAQSLLQAVEFGSERTARQGLCHIVRVGALPDDSAHDIGYGQLHVVAVGQRLERLARERPFGDHVRLLGELLRLRPRVCRNDGCANARMCT